MASDSDKVEEQASEPLAARSAKGTPEEWQTGKILRPRRWLKLPRRHWWAVAASGAAVITAGSLLGLLLEQRRSNTVISELETGLEEAVTERDALRAEQSRFDSMIKNLEAGLQAALTERDSLIGKLRLEQLPEIGMPWLLAPPGITRGSPERLVVPPEARSIGMLIDAKTGDRFEILDSAGDEVWSVTVEGVNGRDEALVRIPVARMPPGDYDVKVWRRDVLRIDFELEVRRP